MNAEIDLSRFNDYSEEQWIELFNKPEEELTKEEKAMIDLVVAQKRRNQWVALAGSLAQIYTALLFIGACFAAFVYTKELSMFFVVIGLGLAGLFFVVFSAVCIAICYRSIKNIITYTKRFKKLIDQKLPELDEKE